MRKRSGIAEASTRTFKVMAAFACLAWAGSAHANSVTDWNAVAVQYVVGGGGIPAGRPGPVGFLDLAVVQAAVHDAVQALEHKYQPYLFAGSGEGKADAAVAAAAHRALVQLYPLQQASLDQRYNNYVSGHGLAGDPGLAVGEAAAAALASQYRPLVATTPFVGGTGPGEWRPAVAGTPMAFLTLAYTTPFTLERVSQFRPEPPPPLTSTRYVREYNEVKALGNKASYPNANTALADYWNGDPLPRWNGAIQDIMANKGVGESARAFALANLATADALMAVFEAKRFYHFWRPSTAIQNDEDGNPKTARDASWTPYLPNPPYPDYPSGMNGVSGAMTEMLRLVLGTDNVSFSMPGPTSTRHYSSFSQAAQEVVEVRILHGIHFRSADEDGRQLGGRVAHWAFQNYLRPSYGKDEGVKTDWVVEDVN